MDLLKLYSLNNMPQRIQRKRTKGWKMPTNTVYVGRPTKWGNPYPLNSIWSREEALSKFKEWADKWLTKEDLAELKGRDLACWCREGEACHADYLLLISNKQ
jgi:hypothetical protein